MAPVEEWKIECIFVESSRGVAASSLIAEHKKKEKPQTLELPSKAIQQALNVCIRRAQDLEFAADIDSLRRNVEVPVS